MVVVRKEEFERHIGLLKSKFAVTSTSRLNMQEGMFNFVFRIMELEEDDMVVYSGWLSHEALIWIASRAEVYNFLRAF